jgi:hypothetical protein
LHASPSGRLERKREWESESESEMHITYAAIG